MRKIIAIDLGGTNLRVALVQNNKILKYLKEKTPKDKQKLLDLMSKLIENLMSKDVKAIGVASAGPLKEGVIKNPPNLPLKNFNLKRYLEKKFKKRIMIANDADCVALAESKLGCKKKNFIVLTLGTGIGGGIVINGKVYSGNGYGGELGYIILNQESFEESWKGNRGNCKKPLLINDKKSKKIIKNTIEILSKGIGSLINIFDPEIVILSGGIKETGDRFLNQIKKKTKKYILIPNFPEIKWTNLKHPGVLGASLLIK